MDELAKELASARGAVMPAWSEAREERLLAGVSQLRRKRRAQRVVTTGLASLAAVGLLYFGSSLAGSRNLNPMSASLRTVPVGQSATGLKEPGLRPTLQHATRSVPPTAAASRVSQDKTEDKTEDKLASLPIKLADGSRVKSLSRGAAVAVEGNEPNQIRLRLDAGGARFDVIPNKQREFTVRAGTVEVNVLGTVFDVERADGRVRVSVSRGKVRVRTGVTPNGSIATAIVKAGESHWFDDLEPSERGLSNQALSARQPQAAERVGGSQPSAAKSVRGARHTSAARERTQDDDEPRAAWRSLSQSGDYEGAYRLLQQSTVEDDDSGALLDAADAARLSGHPQAAVTYLRKVLDQHRESPVAPLAAFTLGRVLLERLGQPSEAADAFTTARQLAPTGSLAQDALAREVEAWSKAGRPDDAYRAAREYVDTYPKGRRLRAVQLYGGL